MYNEYLYNETLYNRDALIPSYITVTVGSSGVSVLQQGFKIDQRINSFDTATFRIGPLTNEFVSKGDEVVIRDTRSETNIFGGYIRDINIKFITPTTFIQECQVQGYAVLLSQTYIPERWESAGPYSEYTHIHGLLVTYLPEMVILLDANDGDWDQDESVNFGSVSLRSAIETLAKMNYVNTPGDDRTWYVDADKDLHYFCQRFSEAASFGLSDSPDNSTTFPYQYNNFEYTTSDDDTERVIVTCWRHGLHAGQLLEITNSVLGWSAKTLQITNIAISIKKLSDYDYALEYRLTLGSLPVPQISTQVILPSNRVIDYNGALLSMPQLNADPTTGYTGQTYYNTDTQKTRIYTTAWGDISAATAFATPSIVLGSSAAAGSATTVIKSDATIAAFDATSPSTQAFGDSAVVGTAAFAARRDHKHAMPAHTATQQTQADFNPDRAFGTEYQNTSGKVMIVTVSGRKSAGLGLDMNCFTGATSPASVNVATCYIEGDVDSSITFVVPANYYYTVSSGDTLLLWTEWTIG